MNLTRENLKCKICKNVYFQPTILSCCRSTICKTHINEFILKDKETFIKCPFCAQELEIPKNGFRSNEYAHELIELNTHLNDLTKDIQLELEISFIELNYIYQELERKLPDVENFIPSYLAEIRVKIELQRKHLKSKIDLIADQCVRKSREYEEKCMQDIVELKQTIRSLSNKDILIDLHQSMTKLFDLGHTPVIDEINGFRKEINGRISQLEKQMNELKYLNFKIENSNFEPEKNVRFGELKLVNDYQLISCADDKLIKIRNLNEKSERQVLKGHKNNVHFILLTDDGQLISGGSDKLIKFWDLKTLKCVKSLSGHMDAIRHFRIIHPNRLASASNDKTIRIWDLNDSSCIKILSGHKSIVYYLEIFAAMDILASSSHDTKIRLWDLKTFYCLKTLSGHGESVVYLKTWNEKLISCSNDKTIRIWDLDEDECELVLKGHTSYVTCVELFVDNLNDYFLLSGSLDMSIKKWNLANGQCLATLNGHTGGICCICKISEHKFITGSIDNTIKLWDLFNETCVKSIYEHEDTVRSVICTPLFFK